jgi:very-short-patch-repair endonuclease
VDTIALCDAQGLPRPIVNTDLLGEEVDFQWPGSTLVVELDGVHHTRSPNRRDDARRDAKLQAAGYEVIRVPEPADVVDLIRRGR